MMSKSLSEEYHQFLSDLGQTICDKISRDEDVEALKQLEDKEYLLEKIKEIIQSVYELKNKELIVNYVGQIEQQRMVIDEQDVEIRKLVELIENQKHTEQTQKNQKQQTRLESELQKQNWQLNKRLIEQDQQQKLRVKQFAQTLKLMEHQSQSSRQSFTSQLSQAIQTIKLWQEKYKILYQQKSTLETVLEQQVDRLMQQEMKTKEVILEKEEIELTVEKMTRLNKGMKQNIDRLEDKVLRLEKNKESFEQQISTYQEEIRVLKRVNQDLSDQNTIKNKFNKSSFSETKQLIKNLKEVEEQQQKNENQEKLRKMFELQKKVQKAKMTKNQIELQYHEYKLATEKKIFQLQQGVNELNIKHEKQLRIMKQQFIEEKQALIDSHQRKLKDTQQNTTLKDTQQLQQLESTLKSTEQKLTKSRSQLKDLQTFMHEKQLHYNDTLNDLEKKNQEFRAYIKQLQKSIKEKSSSSGDFIKQYGLRVQACEEEVNWYKKENDKLRKEIETVRKELDKANLLIVTEKNNQSQGQTQRKLNDYKKEDYEQYIKTISELKQKILIMENEHKFLQKQSYSRLETIEELKVKNEKLEDRGQKYSNQANKLEKELVNARKQLTEQQTSHHQQLTALYKANEQRIQTEKKQLVSHYEQLLKNREERLSQCRSSTVIYEHQLTISNMRNNIENLREKNLSLQQKIQTLNSTIKELNKEITQREKLLDEAKDQSTELAKEVFALRQEKVLMEKSIREKLKLNQLMFREFKFQVDAYLRTELGQLRQLAKCVVKMVNEMRQSFTDMKQRFSMNFFAQSALLQSQLKNQLKSMKSHYEHDVNITHKITIQELEQDFKQKLKQHQVESMAEIASRQYMLKEQQRQTINLKSTKGKLQLSLKAKEEQTQKLKEQLRIIKQVNQKMSDKSTKLQKHLIQTQRDIKSLQTQNQQLKLELTRIEQLYQQKLDQCREKYIQENQKLFAKYEREFDKLITMNVKVKNTALSSMMFSSIAPTKEHKGYDTIQNSEIMKATSKEKKQPFSKQFSNYDSKKQPVSEKKESSKLQNIKKEILLQKKKLQTLDSTKAKLPTKGTTSTASLIKHKKMLD